MTSRLSLASQLDARKHAPWQIRTEQRRAIVRLRLREGGGSVRKVHIKKPYFDAIMSGRKTLRLCVGYENIKQLKAGGLLQLEASRASGVVRIKSTVLRKLR